MSTNFRSPLPFHTAIDYMTILLSNMFQRKATKPTISTTRLSTTKRSLPSPQRRGPLKKRKIIIQQRPQVRFNEHIEVHKQRVFKTPLLPSTTWLKEKDLIRIRDGIFSTLEAMKKERDSGMCWKGALRGNHCARGLEDYSIDRKGSLKSSTIHRRQNAIRSVLHEQEMQLKRIESFIPKDRRTIVARCQILDHAKLSRVYQKQTRLNIHEAIHIGRVDSEQALAIYSERPLKQQSYSKHRRQLLLPSFRKYENKSTKQLETTWGFATTTAVRPNHSHRRVVSLS